MIGRSAKHKYPKDYGFLRHKSWKDNGKDVARKQAKQEVRDELKAQGAEQI